MAITDWSITTNKIADVTVGDTINDTLTWSKKNYNVLQYRVFPSDYLAKILNFAASPNGITISGKAETPWGYLTVSYKDKNDKLITGTNISDIFAFLPLSGNFKNLIEAKYDSEQTRDFTFIAEVDWEQLDPITKAPLNPPVTGTDSVEFYYTFHNDWTGNKYNIDTIVATENLIHQNKPIPDGKIFGDGPFGVGPFGR